MSEVLIDEVLPGSALGDALRNAEGAMILSRGTVLTESILNRLRRMGIESLPINSDPEKLERERILLLSAVEDRFRGTENNPFLRELRRCAEEHLCSPRATQSPGGAQ